ncbi:MAG: citrate lyase subunit alpha [Candidatus Phytoplasma australasiaticum]|nr:citrate lyase subunit alpha [Candidatus Phytoplasma australasiaticum]
MLNSLEEAIVKSGLKDGMTISRTNELVGHEVLVTMKL